ncbi:MAG: MotA/TolQ/ExbB proton channel family protein [Phaeodactylibacter sp.]|nr:MotA/TolQ/ExbB proton channel family protein [Phaeodactylibacter sp.]
MEITSKTFNIFISFVGGAGIWVLLCLLALFFPAQSPALRYIEALGGSAGGIIQAICYGLFIFALLDLREKLQSLDAEYEAFNLDLLPSQEHLVLSPEEVAEIKLEMAGLEQKGIRYLVTTLIKKACTQYRNENSTNDTYNVLSSQVRTSKEEMEGSLEMTRYIIQVIPMLGFIGTVIGLANGIANSKGMLQINPAEKEQALYLVVDNFSMAFGTSLVALILGVILSRSYHVYLGRMDVFFSRLENYIIENLISRIYRGPGR